MISDLCDQVSLENALDDPLMFFGKNLFLKMDELTKKNGMNLKYHTSLAYSSTYKWDEKNEKRQMDLPYT